MDKMNEFGRRLRLVWAGLVTLAAISMLFEAYIWWAPLAASPTAYAPLFTKVRMSVRLAGAGLGTGFMLAVMGISGPVEAGLFIMAFSVLAALIWEVMAFLLAPIFAKDLGTPAARRNPGESETRNYASLNEDRGSAPKGIFRSFKEGFRDGRSDDSCSWMDWTIKLAFLAALVFILLNK